MTGSMALRARGLTRRYGANDALVILMRDGAFADDNHIASTAAGTVYDGRR